MLTAFSADEGIDFYGRLHLEKLILPRAAFPGWQRQLSVWMVGQAKHYFEGKVSTPAIRELVGAVMLASKHAFGSADDKYQELTIRACDPVFYLFFTTGRLTSNSWKLLDRSGAIGMDGEMLGSFLADRGVGMEAGRFDRALFDSWLSNLCK